jgi:hypothetical protein
MTRLGVEIDGEARKNCIDRGNFAKTPTAMKAITTLGEKNQSFNVLLVQLSGRDQFFELFSHILK